MSATFTEEFLLYEYQGLENGIPTFEQVRDMLIATSINGKSTLDVLNYEELKGKTGAESLSIFEGYLEKLVTKYRGKLLSLEEDLRLDREFLAIDLLKTWAEIHPQAVWCPKEFFELLGLDEDSCREEKAPFFFRFLAAWLEENLLLEQSGLGSLIKRILADLREDIASGKAGPPSQSNKSEPPYQIFLYRNTDGDLIESHELMTEEELKKFGMSTAGILLQDLYDLREATGFISGSDLHDAFKEATGDPSPSGNLIVDVEKFPAWLWKSLWKVISDWDIFFEAVRDYTRNEPTEYYISAKKSMWTFMENLIFSFSIKTSVFQRWQTTVLMRGLGFQLNRKPKLHLDVYKSWGPVQCILSGRGPSSSRGNPTPYMQAFRFTSWDNYNDFKDADGHDNVMVWEASASDPLKLIKIIGFGSYRDWKLMVKDEPERYGLKRWLECNEIKI